MKTPEHPLEEVQRVSTLKALRILDTPTEENFDRVTRITSISLGVPIALVSLIDSNRQWFKSNIGMDIAEIPRDISFCGHTILEEGIFEIEDASKDVRFVDNPLVIEKPHIRFYAGRPLQAQNGTNLGTLSVMDVVPRQLTSDQRILLDDFAVFVERELSISQLAMTDELTGLHNRRGLMMQSQYHLNIYKRTFRPVTLVAMNINAFKTINDNCGQDEGDQVLKSFAAGLSESFRDTDILARLTGDEFIVLQYNSTERHSNQPIERLQEYLNTWCDRERKAYNLTFTYGVVEYDPSMHQSVEDMLVEADKKMYESKKTSK